MRVAALVLCVLCLSVPFLALAEEGHGSHGSSLAQKLQSYLKKTAEARGSMKLEESPEHNALMSQLKEKTNSAIGRVFGKMKADTTTTTGAHRSLLQSADYSFKYADSSDGCKKTLEDLGVTDIATQVDGNTAVDFPVDPKYTDCKDFMDFVLTKSFSSDFGSFDFKDFCTKSCTDDAAYWVGAFTSTCVVDMFQNSVDEMFKQYAPSEMSEDEKAIAAFGLFFAFSGYTAAEEIGISTLVGCNTLNAGNTCGSKPWWYEVVVGNTVDNKKEDSSGFDCDATGKEGDYIVPCEQDWSDICDPSSSWSSVDYDTKDCCYTSGAVLANALDISVQCPFQKVYQDIFQKLGFSWPECSKDEIDFKCSKGGRTKYLTGMEGQATQCCAAQDISAVCTGTSIAEQMNKYADGKTDITGGAAATKATLFIVVALVTVNWLGLL